MSGVLLDNGFADRFNFCYLDRNISKVGKNVPATTKALLTSFLAYLNGLQCKYKDTSEILKQIDPYVFTFTDEAKERAIRIHDNELSDIEITYGKNNALIAGILPKVKTTFINGCLLLHCIKHYKDILANEKIDIDTVEKSYRLAQYFMYHNFKTLSSTGYSVGEDNVEKLICFCKRQNIDTVKIRQVQQYVYQGKKSAEIHDILRKFEDNGFGYFIDDKTFKISF